MKINEEIFVKELGDPFSPEDIKEEGSYKPVSLAIARERGRISRHVVDNVLPLHPSFNKWKDRLGLRSDLFPLSRNSCPQALHFDPPMHSSWEENRFQGLIVFGRGTGKTDVLKPFGEAEDIGSYLEALRLAAHLRSETAMSRYAFESYNTGTLLTSYRPFVHRRGETLPGIRIALDFGVLE